MSCNAIAVDMLRIACKYACGTDPPFGLLRERRITNLYMPKYKCISFLPYLFSPQSKIQQSPEKSIPRSLASTARVDLIDDRTSGIWSSPCRAVSPRTARFHTTSELHSHNPSQYGAFIDKVGVRDCACFLEGSGTLVLL